MYHIFILQESLPGQTLHLLVNRLPLCLSAGAKDLGALGCQALPFRHQMILDQAEGSLGHDAGANVEVSGVAGAEGQRMLGEAVLGDMGIGGRKNVALGSVESTWRRWVVV